MPRRPVPDVKNPYLNDKFGLASFSYTAESSNARTATITLKQPNGAAVAESVALEFHLSTLATGADIAAATSGVLAGGASGAVVPVVAGRTGTMVSSTAGVITLVVTDTAVRTLYICLHKPNGGLIVSPALAFA